MNRSIALVALLLCAGCAHTPSTDTDQLAANILLGDSQHPTCGRDEVAYCKVAKASHFPDTSNATEAQASGRCDCVAKSVLYNNARNRVTAPSASSRVR
jgi:hypothetical protein